MIHRKNRGVAEAHDAEQLDLVDFIEKVEVDAPSTIPAQPAKPSIAISPQCLRVDREIAESIKNLQIKKYGGYRQQDGVWISLHSGTPVEVPER